MSASITNTGITFPDSTTQSTAIFGIGTNQTWQDMTASRVAGSNYTNTTGSPIMVSIVCTAGNGTASAGFYVDGVRVQEYVNNTNGSTIAATFTTIVPPESYYGIALTLFTINKWYELR